LFSDTKKTGEHIAEKKGTTRLDTLGKRIESEDLENHISTFFWEQEQVSALCHLVMHELQMIPE
jgi:hypothetical protein